MRIERYTGRHVIVTTANGMRFQGELIGVSDGMLGLGHDAKADNPGVTWIMTTAIYAIEILAEKGDTR